MAVSEAQKRASAKYQRESTKTVSLRFYPSDMELFDFLDKHTNKQGFVKELIRREMEREHG